MLETDAYPCGSPDQGREGEAWRKAVGANVSILFFLSSIQGSVCVWRGEAMRRGMVTPCCQTASASTYGGQSFHDTLETLDILCWP